jgi:hypothetical protein
MTMPSTLPATRALTRESAPARRTIGGYFSFALMVGGWVTFVALLAFAEPTLGELWRPVRDLPLLVEGVVWLLLFPFILALRVWDNSWETWLRLLLVGCFAVGWSFGFWPRKRTVR